VAKDQALKIEILSVKHPGLLLAVDEMFDRYAYLSHVQRMIEEKCHATISLSAISNYKQKQWKRRKDMVEDQITCMRAILKVIGEDGLGVAANALLWQEMQAMTVTEKINLKKVLNDEQKVALLKKQLALAAQEQRLKIEQRRAAIEAGKETDESPNPMEDYAKAQRVVRQVKEIFGIGMTAIEPPDQRPAEIPSSPHRASGPSEEPKAAEVANAADEESA
jgi:hypothetical protein